jgi:PIN domain nuclease of toxin-antitoxin system
MTMLLDTCVFIWLAGRSSKLSSKAIATINDPANVLCLSAATLWEICLKYRIGKLPLSETPRIWLPKQMAHYQTRRSKDRQSLPEPPNNE